MLGGAGEGGGGWIGKRGGLVKVFLVEFLKIWRKAPTSCVGIWDNKTRQ